MLKPAKLYLLLSLLQALKKEDNPMPTSANDITPHKILLLLNNNLSILMHQNGTFIAKLGVYTNKYRYNNMKSMELTSTFLFHLR